MNRADKVYAVVARQVGRLSVDTPSVRADLSKLRRCAGKDLMDSSAIWELVMADDEVKCEVNGEATEEGNAIHAALTLYGLYRQGNSDTGVKGLSFGKALSALATKGGMSYNTIRKRYNNIITAKDLTRLVGHTRVFIRVLSKSGIKLDFAKFAQDLYNYQMPDRNKVVRMRWSAEFYSTVNNEDGGIEDEK